MTIRVWTGIWVLVISIITVSLFHFHQGDRRGGGEGTLEVMFEGSFLVAHVTPFTEDIFAALISIIFIAESVKFVKKVDRLPPPLLSLVG